MKKILSISTLLSVVLLNGCAPLIIGGAAGTAGVIAMQDRGVKGFVHDSKIEGQIQQLWAGFPLLKNLTVASREGRVLLVGLVSSPQMHMKAVELAWSVKGVNEVIDAIQIAKDTYSASDSVGDGVITGRARSSLLSLKGVTSANYTMQTFQRILYVIGTAYSISERQRVVDHLRVIPGVKKVISHINVKEIK